MEQIRLENSCLQAELSKLSTILTHKEKLQESLQAQAHADMQKTIQLQSAASCVCELVGEFALVIKNLELYLIDQLKDPRVQRMAKRTSMEFDNSHLQQQVTQLQDDIDALLNQKRAVEDDAHHQLDNLRCQYVDLQRHVTDLEEEKKVLWKKTRRRV